MRTRVKRAPQAFVRFIDVEQPGMVISRTFEDMGEHEDVQGAYVKVQPTIRSSERMAVDDKAIRERLLAAGAAAVVVAPIVVPDGKQAAMRPAGGAKALSSEQHLRKWFEGVTAARKVVERAVSEALASVSEAGL